MKDVAIHIFLACLFIISSAKLAGQNHNHRFYYSFNYKTDTLGSSSNDILVLSVNDKENIFLSSKFLETDSLNSVHQHKKQYINPQYNSILQYSKENDLFSSYKKLDMNYYHYDFKKKLSWKIHSQKKELLSFMVQKATTTYGGRNWTAWFCNDIQLPYGPYVFHGLPGLILELYDDEDNFRYTLIKSIKSSPDHFKLDYIFEDKPIKIKAKDWKAIQLNYYNNPLYDYKTIGWVMYHKNGQPYTSQDYRNLEIQIKEGIKRYNNPIELDEKIQY
ncbi:GLPGLI family protein [Chryseobacterium piperi]|uniref:GLPGLI family protein n=1 Tax=Chryseobacterium piperi TaxID=558152 RepID=UPI000691EC61|nr:GLPGLI family protein [Chryseobacterium piperi]ASW74086.1 GLPGLI family protein [Chryseobacterium piperi]